mgnify:CR=1 FL=1
MQAVIALGANLGDREHTLAAALTEIAALPQTCLRGASGLYESAALKPEGIDESAPSYLNQVVTVDTELTPMQLLASLRVMENAHGRVRHERWGDRTLDLDIIAFDGLQQDDAELTLPHPRAHERSFVLMPWFEIDPLAELPHGRVAELAAPLAHEVHRVSDSAVQPIAEGQVQ